MKRAVFVTVSDGAKKIETTLCWGLLHLEKKKIFHKE